MQHVLVQQLEKRADVLTVVKERILTTSTCSIMQRRQEQCTFQGMLGLMDMLGGSVKVGGGRIEFSWQLVVTSFSVEKLSCTHYNAVGHQKTISTS